MGVAADERRWQRHHYLVLAGAVLSLAGLIGIQANGGLGEAQWPASTAEFNTHVAANLDDVRAANLADMVLFVHGYVLLALGTVAWVRALPGGRGLLGQVAVAGFVLVVVGGLLDTVENVVLRSATGDLPASDDVVSAIKGLGVLKYTTAVGGAVLLLGVVAWRWWRHRSSHAF